MVTLRLDQSLECILTKNEVSLLTPVFSEELLLMHKDVIKHPFASFIPYTRYSRARKRIQTIIGKKKRVSRIPLKDQISIYLRVRKNISIIKFVLLIRKKVSRLTYRLPIYVNEFVNKEDMINAVVVYMVFTMVDEKLDLKESVEKTDVMLTQIVTNTNQKRLLLKSLNSSNVNGTTEKDINIRNDLFLKLCNLTNNDRFKHIKEIMFLMQLLDDLKDVEKDLKDNQKSYLITKYNIKSLSDLDNKQSKIKNEINEVIEPLLSFGSPYYLLGELIRGYRLYLLFTE